MFPAGIGPIGGHAGPVALVASAVDRLVGLVVLSPLSAALMLRPGVTSDTLGRQIDDVDEWA